MYLNNLFGYSCVNILKIHLGISSSITTNATAYSHLSSILLFFLVLMMYAVLISSREKVMYSKSMAGGHPQISRLMLVFFVIVPCTPHMPLSTIGYLFFPSNCKPCWMRLWRPLLLTHESESNPPLDDTFSRQSCCTPSHIRRRTLMGGARRIGIWCQQPGRTNIN